MKEVCCWCGWCWYTKQFYMNWLIYGCFQNRVPQIMNYNRVFPKKHPYWLLMDVGILCKKHCLVVAQTLCFHKAHLDSLHSCHQQLPQQLVPFTFEGLIPITNQTLYGEVDVPFERRTFLVDLIHGDWPSGLLKDHQEGTVFRVYCHVHIGSWLPSFPLIGDIINPIGERFF